MDYRCLGKTGLRVSRLAFGAGPVSRLMNGEQADLQHEVIACAIERGINWFDTAATYGNGASEENLGRILRRVGDGHEVHVATKVRLMPADLGDIRTAVQRSVEGSLQRLRLSRVTLLQLHNSITARRGDEPTSVTPNDVLGKSGIADAFEELLANGWVQHLGICGIGQPAALREVIQSGRFAAMQVPYHLLNPSAGQLMERSFAETNYGNIIADAAAAEMGILAIRVLAGGALARNPPSPHTLKTPFFPLALYERDCARALQLDATLRPGQKLSREAIRFALAHPQIHGAIVGFASINEIDEAIQATNEDAPALSYEDVAIATKSSSPEV